MTLTTPEAVARLEKLADNLDREAAEPFTGITHAQMLQAASDDLRSALAELSALREAIDGYKWVEWVYEGEALTVEKIGSELADLQTVASEVPLVYEHVTRGCASKATTLAREIIALHDDAVSAEIREAVEEETDQLREQLARQAPLVEVAKDVLTAIQGGALVTVTSEWDVDDYTTMLEKDSTFIIAALADQFAQQVVSAGIENWTSYGGGRRMTATFRAFIAYGPRIEKAAETAARAFANQDKPE